MMGAGKTVVGGYLAKLAGLDFVDADQELERRSGQSIAEIFRRGEPAFRGSETRLLDELTGRHGIVLATGGGVVVDSRNRERLRSRGFVVYLHASPQLLWQRTQHDTGRPLLCNADPLATLEALYGSRDPLYRDCANMVIDTTGSPAYLVAEALLARIALGDGRFADDDR